MQTRPLRPIGIIDFILGDHESRVKVYANILVFIVPVIVGLLLGFFNLSSYFIGGLATTFGALLSVSTAFFHPKMLAPPLQMKIRKARLVYSVFILIYGLLGTVGAYCTSEVPVLLQTKSFHFSIFINVISQVFFLFCAIAFNFLIQYRFKKEFPNHQAVNLADRMDKQLFKMITVEVFKTVSEATATALKSVKKDDNEEDLKELISGELERHIPQIPQMIDLAYKQTQVRKSNYSYGEIKQNYATTNNVFGYSNIHFGDYSLTIDDYIYGSDSYELYQIFDSVNNYISGYLGGYDWGYGYGDNSRYLKWHYPGYFS